jgi:hypothetical protein
MKPEAEINQVKDRYAPELLKLPGVVGLGVERDETGRYFLLIHVNSDSRKLLNQLPKELDGHEVRVLFTGSYSKQPAECSD